MAPWAFAHAATRKAASNDVAVFMVTASLAYVEGDAPAFGAGAKRRSGTDPWCRGTRELNSYHTRMRDNTPASGNAVFLALPTCRDAARNAMSLQGQ